MSTSNSKSKKERIIGKSPHKILALICFILFLLLLGGSVKNLIVGFQQELWTYLYHLIFLVSSILIYLKYRIIYFEKEKITCVKRWNNSILFEFRYEELEELHVDRGRGGLLYGIKGSDKKYNLETYNVFLIDLIIFFKENQVTFTTNTRVE